MAFNMFASAGILQGIMARALQGNGVRGAEASGNRKRARHWPKKPGDKSSACSPATKQSPTKDTSWISTTPPRSRICKSASAPSWTSTSIPNEDVFHNEVEANRAKGNPWVADRNHGQLKDKARAAGL